MYPGVGENRFTYFGSTPITHALNEPAYVVQAHPPGTPLIPNGLPVYTLYYENDDDGRRMLGADSRVAFTAPSDGDYLARVSDVRGMGGKDFNYQLTIRPAQPDFEITIGDKDLTIGAGSGKEFTVTAARKDEFDGEIQLDFADLPPGFHVTTSLTIEAGQTAAYGTITADADAPVPTPENSKRAKVAASAMVDGKKVQKPAIELGELKLAPQPKFLVQVLPLPDALPAAGFVAGANGQPTELAIAPGETISATLRVERNGFDEEIKLGGEHAGRNLPHGVYVANTGLNGVTLLKGETERTIFITARKWVHEQSRLFHLRADADEKQTSWPVMLHVRKPGNVPVPASQKVAVAPNNN